jgi:prophage antirepressor-like protein
MSDIQVFDFETNDIRTIVNPDRSIHWCGKDAAGILGYKDTRDALERHVKEKYKGRAIYPTPSGKQEMVTISTPGLIQLIMSSKLLSAEAFQDWVLEVVLPSVLATGTYKTPKQLHLEETLRVITAVKKAFALAMKVESQDDRLERTFKRFGIIE